VEKECGLHLFTLNPEGNYRKKVWVLLGLKPGNPDCRTGAPRKSVEIFLGGGKLYHVSIRQTNVQLASPIICVQMIDHCGKPFAHRNPGVVLLSS
jgi:hypothetical protein